MAYEHMTYEAILQRMMDRVHIAYPNLDTREGSILFTALAPAALELAIAYTNMDIILYEFSVDTASREFLLLSCKQMGMDVAQFDATAGTHKAAFNTQVSIGSRWNHDLFNYTVTEYVGTEEDNHIYHVVCETTGTSPNGVTGDLTPITENPSDLTYAHVMECIIEGDDETVDDDIRTAYYEYINSVRTDGNMAQYKQWCDEYEGVGNSKVFPLWDGANTVKVSILSSSNRRASDELVADVQEYFDPNITGMGNGVAPIGAFVTVSTATELPLNIGGTVTLKPGFSDTTVINKAITDYLASIAFEKTTVPYMTIGATILGVNGVESVSNLTVNGTASDIILDAEEIPVLGTTDWTVV